MHLINFCLMNMFQNIFKNQFIISKNLMKISKQIYKRLGSLGRYFRVRFWPAFDKWEHQISLLWSITAFENKFERESSGLGIAFWDMYAVFDVFKGQEKLKLIWLWIPQYRKLYFGRCRHPDIQKVVTDTSIMRHLMSDIIITGVVGAVNTLYLLTKKIYMVKILNLTKQYLI